MKKAVLNDTLTISISVTSDLTLLPSDTTTIEYRKPGEDTGSLTATVTSGVFSVTIDALVLDELGVWYFWPKVVRSAVEIFSGSAIEVEVVNAWERLGKYN